jgi:hypothetical protein
VLLWIEEAVALRRFKPPGMLVHSRAIGWPPVVGPHQDPSDEVRNLFEAAQEVARESVEIALRVADERGLNPNDVLRSAAMTLTGLTLPRRPMRPPSP